MASILGDKMRNYTKVNGIIIVEYTGFCVVLQSLRLGGRSHEAYSNSVVCVSVILSVTSVLQRTQKDES